MLYRCQVPWYMSIDEDTCLPYEITMVGQTQCTGYTCAVENYNIYIYFFGGGGFSSTLILYCYCHPHSKKKSYNNLFVAVHLSYRFPVGSLHGPEETKDGRILKVAKLMSDVGSTGGKCWRLSWLHGIYFIVCIIHWVMFFFKNHFLIWMSFLLTSWQTVVLWFIDNRRSYMWFTAMFEPGVWSEEGCLLTAAREVS